MRKGKELSGLALVDIATGTKLGSVEDAVISPQDGRILGVMAKAGSGRGDRAYVPASGIRAFGADAVTVTSSDVLRGQDELDETAREAWDVRQHLVGNKVITEGGRLLGSVSDYYIDEDAVRVAGLTIGGGLLSSEDALAADRIVSVGPDAVVVRDEHDGGRERDDTPYRGWGVG